MASPEGSGAAETAAGTDDGATFVGHAAFTAVEQAVSEGRKVADVAKLLLEAAGFRAIEENVKLAPAVQVSFRARDERGQAWCFDLAGGFSPGNPGLRRADTLWKALGRASVVAATGAADRLVLLTVERPPAGSAPAKALAAVCGAGPDKTVADVIALRDPADQRRLRQYATGEVDVTTPGDSRERRSPTSTRRVGGSRGRRPPGS